MKRRVSDIVVMVLSFLVLLALSAGAALVGVEAVLPPESAVLPVGAEGDWFGAGTGWGYGERIGVHPAGQDAAMLPHAEDLLTLARFAFERGEAIAADQAAPVYLRDKVAQTKAERGIV